MTCIAPVEINGQNHRSIGNHNHKIRVGADAGENNAARSGGEGFAHAEPGGCLEKYKSPGTSRNDGEEIGEFSPR
jgi:hypothetical protein